MKIYPIRLGPGLDLKLELDRLAAVTPWKAACLLSAVGSLTEIRLRYANQPDVMLLTGHYEILSLSGTVCPDGSHLHLTVADHEGRILGGHLKEGSLVYTTAELVVGVLEDWAFSRVTDPATGFPELDIHPTGE